MPVQRRRRDAEAARYERMEEEVETDSDEEGAGAAAVGQGAVPQGRASAAWGVWATRLAGLRTRLVRGGAPALPAVHILQCIALL